MLRLRLDTSLPSPLVEQIVSGTRTLIDRGVLASGTRLPSIRTFAKEVSTFTVVEAYERLVALGVLVSRPGAGFYVRDMAKSTRFSELHLNIEQA